MQVPFLAKNSTCVNIACLLLCFLHFAPYFWSDYTNKKFKTLRPHIYTQQTEDVEDN